MPLSLTAEASSCLAQHHVMTLATHGGDGPWAAAVFYVADGDDLLFLSSPISRHCRHLAQDPRCAATIHSETDDWLRIQGLQLEGVVSELEGIERERAQHRYAQRFAFVQPGHAPEPIAQALARVHWYRLRIGRLYFIDNERGFGRRLQFDA